MPYKTSKSEIENKLYEQNLGTKKDISTFVSMLFDVIADELAQGNEVQIRHFGTFKPKKHKGRTMFNHIAQRQCEVKPNTTIGFKAATLLKELCKD